MTNGKSLGGKLNSYQGSKPEFKNPLARPDNSERRDSPSPSKTVELDGTSVSTPLNEKDLKFKSEYTFEDPKNRREEILQDVHRRDIERRLNSSKNADDVFGHDAEEVPNTIGDPRGPYHKSKDFIKSIPVHYKSKVSQPVNKLYSDVKKLMKKPKVHERAFDKFIQSFNTTQQIKLMYYSSAGAFTKDMVMSFFRGYDFEVNSNLSKIWFDFVLICLLGHNLVHMVKQRSGMDGKSSVFDMLRDATDAYANITMFQQTFQRLIKGKNEYQQALFDFQNESKNEGKDAGPGFEIFQRKFTTKPFITNVPMLTDSCFEEAIQQMLAGQNSTYIYRTNPIFVKEDNLICFATIRNLYKELVPYVVSVYDWINVIPYLKTKGYGVSEIVVFIEIFRFLFQYYQLRDTELYKTDDNLQKDTILPFRKAFAKYHLYAQPQSEGLDSSIVFIDRLYDAIRGVSNATDMMHTTFKSVMFLLLSAFSNAFNMDLSGIDKFNFISKIQLDIEEGEYSMVKSSLVVLTFIRTLLQAIKFKDANVFMFRDSRDYSIIQEAFELAATGNNLSISGMSYGRFIRLADEKIAILKGMKTSREAAHLKNRALEALINAKSEATFNHNVTRPRSKPFTIMLHGDSGVGKSAATEMLHKFLVDEFLKTKQGEQYIIDNEIEKDENGKVQLPEDFYKTTKWIPNTASEYQDMYKPAKVITTILDDAGAGNVKYNPVSVINDNNNILRMSNDETYMLNSSSVHEKGKIAFRAPLLIVTTNDSSLQSSLVNTNAAAIHRRFEYKIEVKVKPEFKLTNSNQLDPSKVQNRFGKSISPLVWSFDVVRVQAIAGNASRYAHVTELEDADTLQLLRFLRSKYSHFIELQEHGVSSIEVPYEEAFAQAQSNILYNPNSHPLVLSGALVMSIAQTNSYIHAIFLMVMVISLLIAGKVWELPQRIINGFRHSYFRMFCNYFKRFDFIKAILALIAVIAIFDKICQYIENRVQQVQAQGKTTQNMWDKNVYFEFTQACRSSKLSHVENTYINNLEEVTTTCMCGSCHGDGTYMQSKHFILYTHKTNILTNFHNFSCIGPFSMKGKRINTIINLSDIKTSNSCVPHGRDGVNDLCGITLKTGSLYKDIRKYFRTMREGYLPQMPIKLFGPEGIEQGGNILETDRQIVMESHIKRTNAKFKTHAEAICTDLKTVPGDCTKLLLGCFPNGGQCILGLHVGLDKKGALAQHVFRDDIDQFFPETPTVDIQAIEDVNGCSIGPVNRNSKVLHMDTSQHAVIGGLQGEIPNRHFSKVRDTSIKEYVEKEFGYKCDYTAPAMKGFKKDGVWHDPHRIALDQSIVRYMDPTIQDLLAHSMLKDWEKSFDFTGIKPLTLKESINGTEHRFINKVPFKTSAGYPFSGAKRKLLVPVLFDKMGDPIEFDLGSDLYAMRNKMINYWKQGRRCVVFQAHLKDEPRKAAKVALAKTRVFTGAPYLLVLETRRWFLPLVAKMMETPVAWSCAIGVNVNSTEWMDLYKHITKFGDDRIIDFDWEAYDKQTGGEFARPGWDVLVTTVLTQFESELIQAYGKTYKTVLQTMVAETQLPLVDFAKVLIMFMSINPSGHSLTTVINSVMNEIMLRYVYFREGYDLSKFRENIACIYFGDDGVVASHPSTPITFRTMKKHVAELGFRITPGNKNDPDYDYKHVSEITFLKRSWTFIDTKHGPWMAAKLEHESILKRMCVQLASKEVTAEFQLGCSISDSICDMINYGESEYNKFRDKILNMVKKHDKDKNLNVMKFIQERCFMSYDDYIDTYYRSGVVPSTKLLDSSNASEEVQHINQNLPSPQKHDPVEISDFLQQDSKGSEVASGDDPQHLLDDSYSGIGLAGQNEKHL